MEVRGSFMEVTTLYRYKDLKDSLAERLGRENIPTSTLSRWMQHLEYEKGEPGRKRWWELEDLFALYCFGKCLSLGYRAEEARTITSKQVKIWRVTKQWH
jgi:hypothetical protein